VSETHLVMTTLMLVVLVLILLELTEQFIADILLCSFLSNLIDMVLQPTESFWGKRLLKGSTHLNGETLSPSTHKKFCSAETLACLGLLKLPSVACTIWGFRLEKLL